MADLVLDGETNALPKRKLSEETCKFFGYKLASVNGKPCQVAPYHDKEGKLVAQKLRFPNKEFQTRGDFNNRINSKQMVNVSLLSKVRSMR